MKGYKSARYKFTLGDISFTVDIDESLYAPLRNAKAIEDTPRALHFHPMHEIFFVAEEKLTVKTEKRTQEFCSSIFCVPPLLNHLSERSTDYRLLFSVKQTNARPSPLSKFYNDLLSTREIVNVAPLNAECHRYLNELADLFYSGKEALTDEIICSILKILFYKIYAESVIRKTPTPAYGEESYYSIISRMLSRCSVPGNEITLATISEELHLGEKQCSRIVKKYYGKPLGEAVLEEKLLRASYLLATTDLPISDIAKESNFRSENYFFTSFKKRFHLTPLRYRKEIRAHNM